MINSVLKAIDILETFHTDEPRLSLAEISARLGMPRSTTHNLLSTLLSRGFVEKTDHGRYALGPAIVALTQSVRVNVELRDRAAPLLRELADACRESVYLAVLDDDRALYIYAVESPHRLLARTAVGERVTLHCTSLGKAILSRLPAERVEGIVDSAGLPKFTAATITDPDVLKEELERVRTQGYAVDRGEHETGTYCIGAPILDVRGQVIGACSISSLDPELICGTPPECSAPVIHTAQEISRRMGYVPARSSSMVAGRPTL
jgi:DNA-binding IclR family transcriptional regulator